MANDIVFDTRTESLKNVAWWLYLGHALTFVFSLGALSFIPLIINYLKRGEAAGTFVHSHHSWQIRSFWWYAVWMIIGLSIVWIPLLGWVVGGLILGLAWLWKAYRLLKGFIDLNNNNPMY